MNRIPAGHEIVNSAELASLRRKAKSHDAYLWATKRMADKVRGVDNRNMMTADAASFVGGYETALTDFARLVVEAPSE